MFPSIVLPSSGCFTRIRVKYENCPNCVNQTSWCYCNIKWFYLLWRYISLSVRPSLPTTKINIIAKIFAPHYCIRQNYHPYLNDHRQSQSLPLRLIVLLNRLIPASSFGRPASLLSMCIWLIISATCTEVACFSMAYQVLLLILILVVN